MAAEKGMAGRMISHKHNRATTKAGIESETRFVQDHRLHDNGRAGLDRDSSFSPLVFRWPAAGWKKERSIMTLACLFSLPLLALGPLSR